MYQEALHIARATLLPDMYIISAGLLTTRTAGPVRSGLRACERQRYGKSTMP